MQNVLHELVAEQANRRKELMTKIPEGHPIKAQMETVVEKLV